MIKKIVLLMLMTAVTVGVFFPPLRELYLLSRNSELYSHTVLIPFISAYFFWIRRRAIFIDNAGYSWSGIPVVIAALLLYLAAYFYETALGRNDYLSLAVFSAVLFWTGGAILLNDPGIVRRGAFPILFLLFMVPVPAAVMGAVITFLQHGSAEMSYAFLKATGIPLVRDGLMFHLTGISVEVAEQCSGIRSSIALVITGVLAGALFLERPRNKAIIALSVIPLAIVKNSIRILTLTLLGAYVNESWLTSSWLHKGGGIVFFLITLGLMAPLLWWLRKSEKKGA